MASLHELQTVYGTHDLWRLRELGLINKYNEALIKQWQNREHQNVRNH